MHIYIIYIYIEDACGGSSPHPQTASNASDDSAGKPKSLLKIKFFIPVFYDFWGPGTSWRLLWAIWAAGAQKRAKRQKVATLFERYFCHFLQFFYRSFFSIFLEGPCSLPWRHLSAQGLPKSAKRSPKASQKVVGMHFVEHAKTMLFTVREPHGDLPEKVQKPFFSRARCEGAPGSIWKRIWADFLRFCFFRGSLGDKFSEKIAFCFRSDFWSIFGSLLRGAGGRGELRLKP